MDGNTDYTLTNHLDAPSPTGYSSHTAAFVCMLLAGLALLLTGLKRRRA